MSAGADDASSSGRVSRRRFLAGAGGAVSLTVGSGIGTATSTGGREVVVQATAPYAGPVRELTAGLDLPPDSSVDVASAESVTADQVLDGAADVVVAGRPTLSGAPGNDEIRTVVTPVGRATLRPDGDWYDVLDGRRLRDRLSTDGPVVTYSECDRDGDAGGDGSGDSIPSTDDASPRRDPGSVDATRLVRGERSFQYARGLGGVGYYEVDATDLGEAGTDDADAVPVVRLGYAYVTSSGTDDAVRSFADAFASDPFAASDGVVYHVDPRMADAAGTFDH